MQSFGKKTVVSFCLPTLNFADLRFKKLIPGSKKGGFRLAIDLSMNFFLLIFLRAYYLPGSFVYLVRKVITDA